MSTYDDNDVVVVVDAAAKFEIGALCATVGCSAATTTAANTKYKISAAAAGYIGMCYVL